MSVHYNEKKKKYYYRMRVKNPNFMIDGKRYINKQSDEYYTSEKKAKNAEALAKAKRDDDQNIGNLLTIETTCMEYLDIQKRAVRNNQVKVSTFQLLHHVLTKLVIPKLGSIKYSELTTENIESFQKFLLENRKHSTASKYFDKFLENIKFCKRKYHVKPPYIPPFPRKNDFKQFGKERYIDIDNFKIAISFAEPKFVLVLSALFYCGLRVGESTSLTWEKVDFEKQGLFIKDNIYPANRKLFPEYNGFKHNDSPKTESSVRFQPCPPSFWKILLVEYERQKSIPGFKSTWYVFGGATFFTPLAVRYNVKKMLRNANMPELTPHELRHSYATHLTNEGVDSRVIAELMGHADESELKRYAHIKPDKKVEALKVFE
ncbi:tyrosine-type recombinase/integrase [Culicoidibacter larvae]|nr:site-specific integrase [Culicoidibacter larvae]